MSTDRARCEVRADETGGLKWDDRPFICPRPAAAVIEAACVHEHIRLTPVCAWHRDQGLSQGDMICVECYEHDGHGCDVHSRALPLVAAGSGVR